MGKHRPPFSSFFALLLVLLTAAPFTAPFQTFDLAAPPGESPICGGFSNDKASEECAIPTLMSQSIPLFHSVALHPSARQPIAQHPHVHHTVLRV